MSSISDLSRLIIEDVNKRVRTYYPTSKVEILRDDNNFVWGVKIPVSNMENIEYLMLFVKPYLKLSKKVKAWIVPTEDKKLAIMITW